MVVLVLQHHGEETARLARHGLPMLVDALVPDPGGTRHGAAQAGNRQASLGLYRDLLADRGDHRIDQRRHRARRIVGAGAALRRHAVDEQPQRHMHLRRRQPRAGGVVHGLDHVRDQRADPGCGGILDRPRLRQQDRVTHTGDLQQGHAHVLGVRAARPNGLPSLRPWGGKSNCASAGSRAIARASSEDAVAFSGHQTRRRSPKQRSDARSRS